MSTIKTETNNQYITMKKNIAKRHKSRALVKWEGFDNLHNTWIPIAHIENIDPRWEGEVSKEVLKKGIKV